MSSQGVVSIKKQITAIFLLVCVLTVISFLLFYYGRQHKIIIDNRTVELEDGRSFRSLSSALVGVNQKSLSRDGVAGPTPAQKPAISFKFWPTADESTKKAVEMMPRERIMVKTLGPRFNLKFEAYDRMGESLGLKEVDIQLGSRKDAMIRLVKIQNDLPDYVEEYPNQAREREQAFQGRTTISKDEEAERPPSDMMEPPSFGD